MSGSITGVNDAQILPRIDVCAGTLIKDRPPYLTCVDKGLRTDEGLLQNDGAWSIRIGGIRTVAMRDSEGRIALGCVRRRLAILPIRVLQFLVPGRLQQPFNLGPGLDRLSHSATREFFCPIRC